MKILINTTHLHVGGGIQHGLSVINEIIKNPNEFGHKFLIVVSSEIYKQLDALNFSKNISIINIDIYFKPYKINYYYAIYTLNKLHSEFQPDITLSIYGPTYWTPKSIHLMGYAKPHYVYPEYLKLVKYSFFKRFKIKIKKYFHIYFFRKNAKFYYTETEDVSKRLSKLLKISQNKVFTVGNTYSGVFDKPITNYDLLPIKEKEEHWFLTITAYYPHKNLEIIKELIPFLNKREERIKFILTLPEDVYKEKFEGFDEYIINVGPVESKVCPYLYRMSDFLFLPTLLEVFSASYAEAMKMGIPILTSDFSFAKEICGDAAIYFNPLSVKSILSAIDIIINNKKLQNELVAKGKKRLSSFETPESRAKKYIKILEKLYETNNPRP